MNVNVLLLVLCLFASLVLLIVLGRSLESHLRENSAVKRNKKWAWLPSGVTVLYLVGVSYATYYGGTKSESAPAPFEQGDVSAMPDGGEVAGCMGGPNLTPAQYAAGFALLPKAVTNTTWLAVPSNAAAFARWTRRGTSEETFWLPATNWDFVLGTNAVDGVHVSSEGTLSFWRQKGSPRAVEMPDSFGISFLAPLQGWFGIVPPEGRFWHAPTPSNSTLFTWEYVFAGRETNSPVTFQAELFANGDFVYRYAFTNALALTNFVVGAQHCNGGETYALNDTNKLVNGLELRWRAFGILDPNVADHDGDGLSTYDEVMTYATDPSMPDTDLDGLVDLAEVVSLTDPLARDTDGDGLPDGSDPHPTTADSSADSDGDGLPDVWETYWFGSTNVTGGADADTNGDGFSDRVNLLSGIRPADAPPPFEAQAASGPNPFASLRLSPPFALSLTNGMTNLVWERGFDFPRSGGWRQAFLSSAPDRAAPLRLEGLVLEWSCGASNGVFTGFPAGDSLRLPLPPEPDAFTLRLRAVAAAVRVPLPVHLLVWSPSAAVPGAVPDSTNAVPDRLALCPETLAAIPVLIDRSGRPCAAAPGEDEAAATADPFAGFQAEGLSFSPSEAGGVLSAAVPGAYTLSGPSSILAGPGSDPSLIVISPSVEFVPGLIPHGCRSTGGLDYDSTNRVYSFPREYPLDSGCIWRDWHTEPDGAYEACDCSPAVSLGIAESLTNAFSVTAASAPMDGGNAMRAEASVAFNGTAVWSGEAWHAYDWCHDEWESGSELLSGGGDCGCESSCGGGGCGGGHEGDDLGSLAFRIPLGSPSRGRAAGFLWFRTEGPLAVTPSMLRLELNPNFASSVAVVSNAGHIASVSFPGPSGRSLAVSAAAGLVSITVTPSEGEAYAWDIANPAGDTNRIRLVRTDAADNAVRDVTYTLSNDAFTVRADNLTGLTETLERDDRLNAPEASVTETRTVADASGAQLSWTVTVSRRVGAGRSAALRETYRETWGNLSDTDPLFSLASYWEDNLCPGRNGRPRLVRGNGRPWRYTAFDGSGRLTLALDPLDGSSYPGALDTPGGPDTLEGLAGVLPQITCRATVCGYGAAAPGDSQAVADRDKPREESVYEIRSGSAALVSRAWSVFTRGETNGWPTAGVLKVRAASAAAVFGDPANALSLSVDFSGSGVPDALRGLPILRVSENGATGTWDYAFGDYDPASRAFTPDPEGTVVRAVSASTSSGLSAAEYSDAAFRRVLASETRLGGAALSWDTRTYDAAGRHLSTLYSDGTAVSNVYDCCRLTAAAGRDGAVTRFLRDPGDALWSAEEETSLGLLPGAGDRRPVTETFADALGRVTNTVRCVWFNGSADPAYAPLETRTEYPYGTDSYRVTTDHLGAQAVARTLYSDDCEIEETWSGGVTNWVYRYRGGATSTQKYWDGKWTCETLFSSLDANGCRVENAVMESSDYPAVTASVTARDFLGRVVSVATPLGVASNFYGGASGRVIRVSRTGSPDTLHVYDGLGELTVTSLDVDGDGQVSYAGTDRISSTVTRYEEDASNVCWRVTEQSESVGGVTNNATVVREQLTGLSPQLLGRTVTVDARGVTTTVTRAIDAETHVTATSTANSLQFTPAIQLSKYGYALETQTADWRSANVYDGFGRIVTRTTGTPDGFTNNVLTVIYDALGLAVTNRAFYGDDEAVAVAAYDNQGRAVSRTDALGNAVCTGYDAQGQTASQSGAVYPAEHRYDTRGRRVSMKTFRDENGAGDETGWLFDGATGLLTEKVYADDSRVKYGYTADGKLLSRRWARGVTMTNGYDNLGQIVRIDYSGSMFDVFHTYNAFGHTVASSNSFASYEYRNSLSGIATNELVAVGTNACALTRSLDAHGWLAGLAVDGSEAAYGYDEENRLASVSRPEAEAEYLYVNGFVAGYTLTLTNGNAVERLVGRDPYRQELTLVVSNFFNGAFMRGSCYGHDLLGRRERRVDTETGSTVTNAFGYNLRSEVTDAELGADRYAYGYDPIGNRVFHAVNAVTNTYAANALNQYAGLSYEADGNLLSDGEHAFSWDVENRLQTVVPCGATNGSLKAVNRYDHRHRRVTKEVFELSGYTPPYGEPPMPGDPGVWNLLRTHTFVYDGWNLVLETVAHTNGSVDRIEYVWGLDVSGTPQGAGGVGGLLFEKRNGQVYIPLYDANGNVTAYVDANGNFWARYVYNAFGNTTHQSGDMAGTFRFRYSTKYHDMETGYYYYIGRFYHPELGRWLNRDSIEERGGVNLYGFAENDPVNKIDRLGLFSVFPVASSPRDKADKDGSLEWLWASVFIFFSDDEKTALKQHGGGYVLHEKHTEIHIKKCNGNVVKNETQTVQKRIPVTATGLTRAYAATTENSIAPVYSNVANMSGYGKCVQGTISVKAGWYLVTGNKLPPGGGPLKDELSGSLDAEQQHGNINATEGWPSMAIGKFLSFGSLSIEVHLSCSDPYSIHASGRNIARGSLINRIDQYGESRATEGTGYVW